LQALVYGFPDDEEVHPVLLPVFVPRSLPPFFKIGLELLKGNDSPDTAFRSAQNCIVGKIRIELADISPDAHLISRLKAQPFSMQGLARFVFLCGLTAKLAQQLFDQRIVGIGFQTNLQHLYPLFGGWAGFDEPEPCMQIVGIRFYDFIQHFLGFDQFAPLDKRDRVFQWID
jgi:hypothetical protein